VLLVNLLAALNFANVFFKKNKKTVGKSENKKTFKNVRNVTKIKKNVKNVFYIYAVISSLSYA